MNVFQSVPSIAISGVEIHQDADGRYSLNDLHKAAGGEKRQQPSNWLQVQQTQELIAELGVPGIPGTAQKQPVVKIQGGTPQRQGTYVVRELVYAYAMWISPIFHLKVIRSFDAGMTGGAAPTDTLPKDVRAAINRRPHTLSLSHYDRIREDLVAALRRHLQRYPEDRDLVAYVEGVDLPDSALITLHRSDLWEITSRFAAIELIVTHEMAAIHRLEATTGQPRCER
jgi:hypothetical protein